jgi:hypothetical protein
MAEKTYLSWEASEFPHYPKNFAWYLTAGIIVLLVLGFEVLQGDWFGAISLAVIAIFIIIFAMHKPGRVLVSLTSEGVRIENSFIPYAQMKYFWVVSNDNHKTLNIETTAYINRTILVELDSQDPEEVREIMLREVPEHSSTEETFVQRLIHRLKF